MCTDRRTCPGHKRHVVGQASRLKDRGTQIICCWHDSIHLRIMEDSLVRPRFDFLQSLPVPQTYHAASG